MSIAGFEIPEFASAAGQLNHASSGFRDKKEKRAAFMAVSTLFPKDRHACGLAALGLAYLYLEPDYRFATPVEIQKAANGFNTILDQYKGFPDIQAKAHWYLGWIHTALDPQPDMGLKHLWTIVRRFSDIPMNLPPPATWGNLVGSRDRGAAKDQPFHNIRYWSQIALLQIVGQGTKADAVKAFDILRDKFFTSPETGAALKLMLQDPDLAPHARAVMEDYLLRQKTNPYLNKDILLLATGTDP